jgi:hypothetical protein
VAHSIPAHASSGVESTAEITTLIHDPLHDEVLLRLPSAVVLPVGTVVELSDGQIGRVASLRLVAVDATRVHLIVQVIRSQPVAQDAV